MTKTERDRKHAAALRRALIFAQNTADKSDQITATTNEAAAGVEAFREACERGIEAGAFGRIRQWWQGWKRRRRAQAIRNLVDRNEWVDIAMRGDGYKLSAKSTPQRLVWYKTGQPDRFYDK